MSDQKQDAATRLAIKYRRYADLCRRQKRVTLYDEAHDWGDMSQIWEKLASGDMFIQPRYVEAATDPKLVPVPAMEATVISSKQTDSSVE